MAVWILRYGHRRFRDQRASTHVALAGRALGADGMILCGEQDDELLARLKKTSAQWGGNFQVEYSDNWEKTARQFKERGGCFVHLTMYGLPLQKQMAAVRKKGKDCLVLVGSQKVPIEAYELADFNIGVTNQPHSEIAALAIFLDKYFKGKELEKEFDGPNKITPRKIGKNVVLWKKNVGV
ncbi:MAG: tRNA (cytidine(56)-2'-O)-methyltransferase [Candidatus Micrarchaeota archaeon]|nr:tRNA (cytidine(56)-2'-O)-methyltransferase [Candidatus Micrarchaeota archaeon]